MQFKAVFFDFGGVFTSSPFKAFNRYEEQRGLPRDFIRRVNAADPHANAWARLERNACTLDEFCAAFEAEARAMGGELSGQEVLALLAGDLRPEMVEALRRVRGRYKTACLTNNVATGEGPAMMRSPAKAAEIAAVMALFDAVIESSKAGVRKPEPAFYRIACEAVDVPPREVVYLDDLGVNLKPARDMGMTTIKVASASQAIGELESLLGLPLR
jgi:putative hydrolase of the HAD superfamily